MGTYGLLGRKLGHSFSPQIHQALCGYAYGLYEVEPEGLDDFLKSTDLSGMNVTIPYKRDVLRSCASLSPEAERIGSVNTLVRTEKGWHGDNTDYFGFRSMVESSGVDPAGKKAVVFGNGGASLTVRLALADMGAREVAVISRSGEDNYENLSRHFDAEILVNATPVGMYPNTGAAAAGLEGFDRCEAVFDLVYNPHRTALLLDAERRGIKAVNGLRMLVAQAHRSAELFTGANIPHERIGEITESLEKQTRNIVLVGMPGSGKTKKGRRLAELTGRDFVDADHYLAEKLGKTAEEIIRAQGEEAFRREETAVLAELGKGSGRVIATGGGCVTREENYPLLHQNGVIVWVRRPTADLPTEGRPLSQRGSLEEMYARRAPMYERFADVTIDVCSSVEAAAHAIKEAVV
ncbi:MAG: shikimate kinase [Oscillospiraceae bacterium]